MHTTWSPLFLDSALRYSTFARNHNTGRSVRPPMQLFHKILLFVGIAQVSETSLAAVIRPLLCTLAQDLVQRLAALLSCSATRQSQRVSHRQQPEYQCMLRQFSACGAAPACSCLRLASIMQKKSCCYGKHWSCQDWFFLGSGLQSSFLCLV